MKFLARFLALCLLLSAPVAEALPQFAFPVQGAGLGFLATAVPTPPAGFGISVGSGANAGKFIDNQSGAVVVPVGENVSGCEINQNISDCNTLASTAASFWLSVKNSGNGINILRLPINSAYWLGYACGQSTATYQSDIQTIVTNMVSQGLYVILDMHWDAPNAICPIGQSNMPSANSSTFWAQVAAVYKTNPAVMFDLFNEPFGQNTGVVTADEICLGSGCNYNPLIQLNNVGGGGTVTTNITFTMPSEISLLNTVRAAGATNVVLMSPTAYAGAIDTFLTTYNGSGNPDSLHQVGASAHIYGYQNGTSPVLAVQSAGYPIIFTETYGFPAALNSQPCAAGSTSCSPTGGYNWAQSNGIGYMCFSPLNSWSGPPTLSQLLSQCLGWVP